jgi:hypothetical protein
VEAEAEVEAVVLPLAEVVVLLLQGLAMLLHEGELLLQHVLHLKNHLPLEA